MIQAMAEGDVLQVVVWSIIFAIALGMVGERARPIIVLCEALAETMFKFTNIVMRYAPVGVAAAMAYTVGAGGIQVLYGLAWLVGQSLHCAGAVRGGGPPAGHVPVPRPGSKIPPSGAGAGGHCVLDRVQRVRAAAGDGGDGAPRCAAADRVVRDPSWLHLQSRRQHAVSGAGGHLRFTGRRQCR